MPEFIRSGRVVDLALLIVVLELAALLALRVRGRKDLGTPDVPVSYTHLDVYKRQAPGRCGWQRLRAACPCARAWALN